MQIPTLRQITAAGRNVNAPNVFSPLSAGGTSYRLSVDSR
jgi:hypothetical protein